MKALSAGLTFVNFTTVCALALGILASGLNKPIAIISVVIGFAVALAAYLTTGEATRKKQPAPVAPPVSKRQAKRNRTEPSVAMEPPPPAKRYRSIILWGLVVCFAIFALRSFCWLLYIDGGEWRIQSPNNLGDLSLHIAYVKHFASGVPLWPDNPIYVFSKLRYPAGTDLFNAVLLRLGVDLMRGFAWTGLLASIATCFAFYRWGGSFGIAGFLFNGGIAGLQIFRSFKLIDYQGGNTIAWKSIALSMFVTQRGLLYAIPAGLLLLCHWREKYFQGTAVSKAPKGGEEDGGLETAAPWKKPPLPFWVELSLYATMPLFHLHTFLALSIVLAIFFLLGTAATRKELGLLVGSAIVPATSFVWLITDHFHAGSVLKWKPGWVQNAGDFAAPFLQFWIVNFGFWILLLALLIAVCARQLWQNRTRADFALPASAAFLLPAIVLFLITCFVKTAPWEWDNMKILVWAYFLVLPFLWTELIAKWPAAVRATICIALFTSGFVTLFGGLAAGKTGFGLAQRAEVDGVGGAVRKTLPRERFAAHPTYNHPLLLQGRKVVLGYPGHLWTQGFDYTEEMKKLVALLQGEPGWRENARSLHARYLFWGREEMANYAQSKRPWEREAALVATGAWGSIYDLESPAGSSAAAPRQ